LFAIIVGAALLTPLLTLGLMAGAQRLLHRAGVIGRMAPRTVVRSLSRTSVAVAALMVAVSVIIGVGVMIGSFRTTVELWLEDVLQADIYVSPPSLNANQVLTTLDPALAAELATAPGIARAATTRGVDVAAFLPQVAGGDKTQMVRLVAVSEDLAGSKRRYRAAVGDWRATWDAMTQGGVIVNEPMANRFDLALGDHLVLQTDQGRHTFLIVGIAVDFDVNPVVFMHDPVYRQWWADRAISAVAMFVQPGVDVDATVAQLRAAYAGRGDLLMRSNRGVRQNALEVFDRTFAITIALQLLATLVAFIGILSTLMSLQLERVREIGVLRATGMTRRQLWRLSLLETGLMGASAGLLAIPTGFALAVILIYIINLRSFGWTLEMRMDPWEFGRALVVALSAALIAGLYPAWRMGRIAPAAALRSE
jgi:putative ABC transport system permease protein